MQACIAGGIAEAYYGIPEEIATEVLQRLDPALTSVFREFRRRYGLETPEPE